MPQIRLIQTPNQQPTITQLAVGDIAINFYDGKVYIKKAQGNQQSIIEIGGTALTASYALTAGTANSANTANSATTAGTSISASYALTASYLSGYITPFPFTGSALITGSLGLTGSLSSTGDVYLKGIINQTTPVSHVVTFDNTTGKLYITASSAFGGGGSAGSTPGGNPDTVQFNNAGILDGSNNFKLIGGNSIYLTGSLLISGSTILTGSVSSQAGFTGSLLGTSSWAISSSRAISSINSISSSYALTASLAPLYLPVSNTSSMLAPYLLSTNTSSLVRNNQTSSMLAPYVLNSRTSSFATTGSNNFTGTQSISGSVIITGSLYVNNFITQSDGANSFYTYQETIFLPSSIPNGPPVNLISKIAGAPMSMFIEYQIIDAITNTDQRTGFITVNFNSLGTPSSTFTETVTADIGNTSGVTFNTNVGGTYDLQATNLGSNPYTFKAILKYF